MKIKTEKKIKESCGNCKFWLSICDDCFKTKSCNKKPISYDDCDDLDRCNDGGFCRRFPPKNKIEDIVIEGVDFEDYEKTISIKHAYALKMTESIDHFEDSEFPYSKTFKWCGEYKNKKGDIKNV